MARFHGIIKGGRGEATRLGHTSLTTVAQSWTGDVRVVLYAIGDTDCVDITVGPHGDAFSRTLFNGTITDLLAPQSLIQRLAHEALAREYGEKVQRLDAADPTPDGAWADWNNNQGASDDDPYGIL